MRKLILLIAVLLTIVSCSHRKAGLLVEQRIGNIENGLVEFTALTDMFEPETIKNDDFKTLTERMGYYKVPGVGIVVFNDFSVEWAKPYLVLRTGSGQPVKTDTYFQAASTSKLATAAIVLHYVEEGILDLDEDVNDYLKS
jgi:CubicO group peptidase (beta-lactamase class C family)